MKKAIAILMLFAALLGTVTKDMATSKAIKSTYSLSDDSDKDDSQKEDGDTKDVSGKEMADKFHSFQGDFLFTDCLHKTLFSRVAMITLGIENPYQESISLPPEILS